MESGLIRIPICLATNPVCVLHSILAWRKIIWDTVWKGKTRMDWFTLYIESTKFHLWTYIWLHWAWRLGSHSKHTAHKTPFQRKKLKKSLDSSTKSPHSGANKSKGQWLQKVRCLLVVCIKKKSCDRHALDDFVMLLVPQAPPISQLFFALTWYSAGSHRPCFSYLSLIPGRKSKRVLVSSVPAFRVSPKHSLMLLQHIAIPFYKESWK